MSWETTETVVPGSNPLSLTDTVENSEDKQGHCSVFTVKISEQRIKPTPKAKKCTTSPGCLSGSWQP